MSRTLTRPPLTDFNTRHGTQAHLGKGKATVRRFPSLTGLLGRALIILFALVAIWKLALLGLETYEVSRFRRPPVATQPVAAASATDEGLNDELRELGLPGGVVAVSVRNLSTGISGGLQPDRRFPAASLYKLPVMVEVFKQQRLKRFDWDDSLTVTREHWTDGSGILQARVGQKLKIRDLVRLMIEESDNIAANMLTDHVGVASINETMLALGLRNTRVVDRVRENGSPTTSPQDMARLFELMGTGRLVDSATSEEAIRLLEVKQANSWLAGGLPWWGKIAHKWGDLPNARHDAGILYTPRNQIVLVVMTENGNAAAAAELIRDVSRKVVRYFEGPGP